MLINRLTLLLRSPIDGQMYSSEVDDGVGGAILVLVAASSVSKGVDGSDDTSSAFNGISAPSSVSLNLAGVVSFSSLIFVFKITCYIELITKHGIQKKLTVKVDHIWRGSLKLDHFSFDYMIQNHVYMYQPKVNDQLLDPTRVQESNHKLAC